jgi:DNA polymerase (family 10)
MSENLPKNKAVTHKQRSLFPESDKSDALNVLRGLDRAEVEPLASKIVSLISPYCARAEVAGSIRRRKPTVNDIDIVIQPKPQSWIQVIKEIRREFGAVTEKQGEKLATLYVPFASKQGQGYVEVDLYRASEGTWGILLLIRTGSAEHNIYLCNLAIRKGYHLAYSKGLLNEKGEVIASKTEHEVFQALGLDYIPPEDRELKKDVA